MLAFSFFFFSVSFALQVLDSHVHAWMDHSKIDYTYPKGQITDYDWNFADYQRASRASQLPPSEFIFMSLRGVPKHQYILQSKLAYEALTEQTKGKSPKFVGLISNADPTDGEISLKSFIKELKVAAPNVKGIRFSFGGDQPPLSYAPGLRALIEDKLTAEILVTNQTALRDVYTLVKAVPEVTFVLDHLGIRESVVSPELPDYHWWHKEITRLATLPNLYIKISGISIKVPHNPTSVPWMFISSTVQLFGYNRCIYDGNWFMVEGQEGYWGYRGWASSFVYWLGNLKAQGMTQAQEHMLLYQNSRDVYRI